MHGSSPTIRLGGGRRSRGTSTGIARPRGGVGKVVGGAGPFWARSDEIGSLPLRTPILMDDRVAIDLARMRGIETRWTTSVVLEAHRREILDRKAAGRAIEDLVASGLWIRQDVLLRILAILGER